MSQATGRRSFGDIYRQQHAEVSSTRTSKIFRLVTPILLLIAAFGVIKISVAGTAVLAVIAVVLFVLAVVLGRRQRSRQ